MTAVSHELDCMNIQALTESIDRAEKQRASLEKDINDNGDNELHTKSNKLDGIIASINELKKSRSECETDCSTSLDTYNKVVSIMSEKNADHFGNNKDVARTVLRVLATWNNSKLVKYAIIPAFQSPELYKALETIHILSKAGDNA